MSSQEMPTVQRAPHPAAWRIWFKTARPFSLSATVSPLLVGTAVAAYEGAFHVVPFLLALGAGLALQIGANYFNEYFDHRYGLDTLESLGSSTVIFRSEMTATQVLSGGVACFALATMLGLALIYLVGPAIILFGAAGLAIAYFYSARPFKFATRGLGDILVYFAMGFLETWGAYYVQIPHWSWRAFAASVPIGFLVTAILNMNNIRDYLEDITVNKRTLPVRFGIKFGQYYHAILLLGSYVVAAIFAALGLLPLLSLVVLITLPPAISNVQAVLSASDRKPFIVATKRTALLHLQFGVMLAVGIGVAAILKI